MTDASKTMLRALIVEHDASDAELCEIELRRAGFDVVAEVVVTAEEFARRVSESQVDVVLSDYRLPGWTGMDALSMLQERGLDIPLILVTGTLGEERAIECIKQGVADYVLKGNLPRLGLAVRRALDERHQRAEKARADNLIRRLTVAIEQSPAAVFITNRAGIIEYVNDRFILNTGYSANEAVGKTPSILKSETTPDLIFRTMWSNMAAGREWHGEIQNRKKSGELYWDSVSISPIINSAGVVTHYVSVQQDITEFKNAQEQIRLREERFRELADHIKEIFFVMDWQFRETIYISPAYEEIWGVSRNSLYQNPKSFVERIADDDRARFEEQLRRTQQGEEIGDIEFKIIRPDGQVRWILANVVPIRDHTGAVCRISGTALDITERHHAQHALEENEALLRALIATSFDGICISHDGVVLEANRGYADMFGYTHEEIIGMRFLQFVTDQSAPDVRRHVAEGIDGVYEVIGQRKDGSHIILEVAARQHVLGGRVVRIAALRDATEHRKLEDQFRQAQKMEAVGRLAGGVAHDFNNVLTSIKGNAELLLEDLKNVPAARDMVIEVDKAADRAAGLTRQLLAFSRRQVLTPVVLNLNTVIQEVRRMVERLIGEDIVFAADLAPALWNVRADAGQIEQVLVNLIVNARDAMTSGGTITVRTENTRQAEAFPNPARAALTGDHVALIVGDTGSGIDPKHLPNIFEPFFTTKEAGKGTGLGLSTVYGIVQQSGGHIDIDTEVGMGTTVNIYFPRVLEDVVGNVAQSQRSPSAVTGTETILIVEDEVHVRAVIRRALQKYGYNLHEARNGMEALEIIERFGPSIDLIITDLVMPKMGGKELAAQLQTGASTTPIIFMSGYTEDSEFRGDVVAGASYIEKPFTPSALAEKVRTVLSSRPTDNPA